MYCYCRQSLSVFKHIYSNAGKTSRAIRSMWSVFYQAFKVETTGWSFGFALLTFTEERVDVIVWWSTEHLHALYVENNCLFSCDAHALKCMFKILWCRVLFVCFIASKAIMHEKSLLMKNDKKIELLNTQVNKCENMPAEWAARFSSTHLNKGAFTLTAVCSIKATESHWFSVAVGNVWSMRVIFDDASSDIPIQFVIVTSRNYGCTLL